MTNPDPAAAQQTRADRDDAIAYIAIGILLGFLFAALTLPL